MEEYLNDYLSEPQLIGPPDLSPKTIEALPAWWDRALHANGEERLGIVIEAWRRMAAVLPITLTFLENNLREVAFIRHADSDLSMIYEFVFHEADPSYYEGLPPVEAQTLACTAHPMPEELRRFMAEIHNGWTEVASGALGPLPLQAWYPITQDDWELEGLVDWQKYADDRLTVTFNNGGSGYLCTDKANGDRACVIWFSDDKPVTQPDYFAVLDSWIEIGFEEAY